MNLPPERPSAQKKGSMASFEESIRTSNRQGRHAWERFAVHRSHVMQLLLSRAQPELTLCILGPGNLNDVELGPLVSVYREVHLVDIDEAAVCHGLERQGFSGSPRIRVHSPVDLTGILAGTPEREVLAGKRFGVTASTGVITQMLQSVVDQGLPTDETTKVSLAVRDRHLMDLIELTQPGGDLILVTDVVSTSTAPELLEAPPDELEPLMAALVADGNFFTGVNPYRVVALLEEDKRFASLVADVEMTAPWLWAVTHDRQHLTCAVTAIRAG